LCLPFGPASAVTPSAISVSITCNPAPTASASSPSRSCPTSSLIATLTASGTTTSAVVLVDTVFF
jgi:hypothetical protein